MITKKNTAALKGQSFREFKNKLTAKWRLRTHATTPVSDTQAKTTVDILRDLIAMPTTTDNYQANHEALEYITRFLSARGMHVERLTWNGIESLVATTRKTKTPTVFLTGHIDVVPGPPDLFQLKEEGDKYIGRGVLDMKGAVAAYLGVVEELGNALHDYDFGIMIMTDEEVGGFDGAANLAEAGYLAKVMILPDGGSNWNVERFAKGIWHITVETGGVSAHGSRPWEGENAIDKLIAIVQEIKALFPKQDPESSTINVGLIQGGKAINQIPGSATASMDIRFASAQDQTDITAAIRRILASNSAELTTEVHGDPMATDPTNPYIAAYAACTEKAIGHPIEWIMSNAASDGRFFAGKGVQCAVAYPRGGGHHGLEEWIGKETLPQMQSLFVDYIQRVAKTTRSVRPR